MRWNCSRGTHREGGLEFSQAYRSIPDGHRTNGKTGTLGIPVRDASYDESGSSIPGRLLSSRACFRFLDLLNVPKTPPQSVTDVVRTLCNACHETKQLQPCRKSMEELNSLRRRLSRSASGATQNKTLETFLLLRASSASSVPPCFKGFSVGSVGFHK